VRPSSKSNVSRSLVIYTEVTSGGGVLFSFIPQFNQSIFVRFQNPGDFPKFDFTKTFVPTQLDRREPEFGFAASLMHVHVRWFAGFRTVKPDAIPLTRKTVGTTKLYDHPPGFATLPSHSFKFCNEVPESDITTTA
jgi:hypothetical protein